MPSGLPWRLKGTASKEIGAGGKEGWDVGPREALLAFLCAELDQVFRELSAAAVAGMRGKAEKT